jgi:tetratricopeptide (TPR) repeat protein
VFRRAQKLDPRCAMCFWGEAIVLKDAGIPAALDVLKPARTVVEGRIGQSQDDTELGIAHFEEAVDLQDSLPYTEPPHWYYPVRQALAAALVHAGRLDEAEDQFLRALERAPNNGWSYYGLLELYKARGNLDAARRQKPSSRKPGPVTAHCCSSRSFSCGWIDTGLRSALRT